jgi:C-terminal processing protease CtpA/Prc
MLKKNSNVCQWHVGLKQLKRNTSWLSLLALIVVAGACQKNIEEDPAPVQTPDPKVAIEQTDNEWILENMKTYYFWAKQLPSAPDMGLASEGFFNSLLYKFDAAARPDGDRFSFISKDAQELKASLSGEGKATGAEFTLFLARQGSDEVIAQIIYVLPGTPAAKAGLKRGDVITQVNGQTLTRSNYAGLLFDQNTLALGISNWQDNQLVKSSQPVNITKEVVQENPVLLDSVYTVGGKKIGYLVYNQFIPGPNGSKVSTYDQQIDQIFSSFKAEGINELILDLRYNPGGYVSSAVNLASLIGKGIDGSKTFYRQEWNQTLEPELRKEYGDDFFIKKFTAKPQNIGNQINRVYVLTSRRTASASELIINGLRPYMEVITVGTKTTGKNVGSITITDDTGKKKWGLQPIVFKSYNADGKSDFTSGFLPNVEAEEPLELKPLGDTREAILARTLVQISGAPTARLGNLREAPLPYAGSSIERKAAGSNMFEEEIKNVADIQF